MDLLIEVVVQLVVQVVVELLYELLLRLAWNAAAHLLRNLFTGMALSFLAGFALGWLWGVHLAGNATWPKLLWVSIGLGIAALGLGLARHDVWVGNHAPGSLRRLATPPWQWDPQRLYAFALINAGIALGIALSFGSSWFPG